MEAAEGLLETVRRALEALSAAGVTYAVVGPTAMAVHGLHRETRTVDVLIRAGDGEKAIAALRRARLRAATPTHAESGEPSGNFVFSNDNAGCHVVAQLALAEPERTVCEQAEARRIFGAIGRVATLDQLLALQHVRQDADAPDDFATIVRSKRADLDAAARLLGRELVAPFRARVKAVRPLPRWRNRFMRGT